MNPVSESTAASFEPSFSQPLARRLFETGVIAVVVIDEADAAVPLARALVAGGITAIELTLRTDAAIESIRRIAAEVAEMTVGAGTVLTARQMHDAADAGAAFAVAPGTNPETLVAAREVGLSFAPGVCTPSDIEVAVAAGFRLLKFFPAEPSGGLAYLRSVAAPFDHLGVRFIPLGGVGPKNAEQYLRQPAVHAIGGSWLAPRDTIRKQDWATITGEAKRARELVSSVRSAGESETGQ